MNETEIAALSTWIVEAGLAGSREPAILAGFCERLRESGSSLVRGQLIVDTLHPLYEGRSIRWDHGSEEILFVEYGPSGERWLTSPFYHMRQIGESLLHRRLEAATDTEFPVFAALRQDGVTGVVLIVNRFAAQGAIGEMDSVYSSWSSEGPQGFTEAEVETLRRLAPFLALAIKSVSLARIAETLVETYLGRDAGRRVLSGRIARGVAEEIKAVLWFSDLRDFTRITDSSPPEQIIPMLNDYADVVVSAIHDHGGDVLKLIGDGVLAIFPAAERKAACRGALDAARDAIAAMKMLNTRRVSEGLPATGIYLGLHIGRVFYGNIGSRERLDFTVIGPAVNEVSRIAAMCRSVDQPLLMSDVFTQGAPEQRNRFLSVGRFALRGVAAPQELFTLDWGE